MKAKALDRREMIRTTIETAIAALVATSASGQTKKASAPKSPFKVKIKTVEDYQVAAGVIANAAARLPPFRALLIKQPIATLRLVGLSNDPLKELVREDAWLRKIDGVADCVVASTCICSDGCCVTCWLGTDGLTVGSVDFGKPDPVVKPSPKRDRLLANLINKGHLVSPT